jgi:murein DD-endopeptidase MepM/ murein hydrolase activator NlpD
MRPGPVLAVRRTQTRLPQLYRGAKSRGAFRDIYAADHTEPRIEGRFRWFMSTCLAAAVGAVAIVVVVVGSTDPQMGAGGIAPALDKLKGTVDAFPLESKVRRDGGLNWAVPKADRLQVLSGAMSTRYVIHETLRQKRGGREYIYAKPYVRIVARLAPVPAEAAAAIPPFNPYTLYANSKPIGTQEDGSAQGASEKSDVVIRVVELLGGILPAEDGQEIDASEAQDLVARALAAEAERVSAAAGGGLGEPGAEPLGEVGAPDPAANAPNTTVAAKSGGDGEDLADDYEGVKRVVKTVREGEKLAKILADAGADTWQVHEMLEAMKTVLAERSVVPGQQVHIALAPALTRQNRLEPVRFSIYDDGHAHRVTVSRNNAGEFVASPTPVNDNALMRVALGDDDHPQTSSLYAALYNAALAQSVPPATIMDILRVHAYETDYRRRLRAGDSCELFFDLKDEGGTEGPPGELLYSAISAGGETRGFYRFRTPDGQVDYYDARGNNSKKFLMRKPVRAEDVRLTAGFGPRFHPLLNEKRMHTGVDWASPVGTPILAAGTGTIEEAGRKGAYGNYIRIRHANGYQTAYGHMSRFAEGAASGVKVRQGQVIGYVGSTGLSSGPHLHFEVLVNKQFVDPLAIQVGQERQLEGRDLIEFQKERQRIDDLMHRAPITAASR